MRKNTDSFELIDLLGTGAFAHTWRVRVIEPSLLDAWGQEEVAIKIPLSKQKQIDLQNDIDLNASLHRQLTELEARNIVRYLGTWVYDGKLVMVMKYIRDGSLRNMMGSIYHRERLDFDKVLPIAKGILTGLSMIHKQRIIHRDIKPENILMDGLTPKIADFGIGRIIKTNEMASGKGTLYYMSPELLEDEGRATFNADIWSVGITIYEMLCARFPFGIDEKAPPPKVLKLILDEELKPVFPRDVSIPPGFKQIILKMLDKNPHSRYKTA
jgi:serine/threonine protein kinase